VVALLALLVLLRWRWSVMQVIGAAAACGIGLAAIRAL
jgi:hypothetical protein